MSQLFAVFKRIKKAPLLTRHRNMIATVLIHSILFCPVSRAASSDLSSPPEQFCKLFSSPLSDPSLQSALLAQAIENIPEKGVNRFQLKRWVAEWYKLTHGDGFSKKNPLQSLSRAEQELILREVQATLLTEALLPALQMAGKIRNPTTLERLREWHSRNVNTVRVAKALSLYLFWVMLFREFTPPFILEQTPAWATWIPPWVPRFNLAHNTMFSPALTKRIQSFHQEGGSLNELYTALRREVGWRPKFDMAWKAMRTVYYLSVFTMMFESMTSIARMMQNTSTLLPTQNAAPVALSPQEKQQQFQAWIESFTEVEGRAPDTLSYPDDKEEWHRAWKSLYGK